MMTPSERLRPRMGRARIDYSTDGLPIVRRDFMRMDPHVSAGERRFSDAFETVACWVAVLALCGFGWWVLIEGSKLAYSFIFNHPIGR